MDKSNLGKSSTPSDIRLSFYFKDIDFYGAAQIILPSAENGAPEVAVLGGTKFAGLGGTNLYRAE